jgi:SnoaL-like protein
MADDMSDRESVAEVVVRFFTAMDDRAWDVASACLTEDFRYDQPRSGEHVGKDAFFEQSRAVESRLSLIMHYITNLVVEIAQDEARARMNALVVHVFREGEATELANSGARIEQLLRRTPNGWRISRLSPHPMWRDDRYMGLLQGSLHPGKE